MYSLNKVKMRKVENLLSSKKDVRKARATLEQRTEEAFKAFAESKRKTQEMVHHTYFD